MPGWTEKDRAVAASNLAFVAFFRTGKSANGCPAVYCGPDMQALGSLVDQEAVGTAIPRLYSEYVYAGGSRSSVPSDPRCNSQPARMIC